MRRETILLAASLLAFVVTFWGSALVADEPTHGVDWPRLVASGNDAERREGMRAFREDRWAKLTALLEVVDAPVEPHEPFYSPSTRRNTAIRLLGELRAPEAVRPLTERLMPRAGQDMTMIELTDLSPAGWALVAIGMPTVPTALDILASVGVSSEDKGVYVHELIDGVGYTRRVGPPLERSSPLGDQCLRILVRIKGLEETEAGLRRYIATETDAARKKNLEDALTALSRPSLRQGLEASQAQKEARERRERAGLGRTIQVEEAARQEARRRGDAAGKAAAERSKNEADEQPQPKAEGEPDPAPPAEPKE